MNGWLLAGRRDPDTQLMLNRHIASGRADVTAGAAAVGNSSLAHEQSTTLVGRKYLSLQHD